MCLARSQLLGFTWTRFDGIDHQWFASSIFQPGHLDYLDRHKEVRNFNAKRRSRQDTTSASIGGRPIAGEETADETHSARIFLRLRDSAPWRQNSAVPSPIQNRKSKIQNNRHVSRLADWERAFKTYGTFDTIFQEFQRKEAKSPRHNVRQHWRQTDCWRGNGGRNSFGKNFLAASRLCALASKLRRPIPDPKS
jgi:hypothetical protein